MTIKMKNDQVILGRAPHRIPKLNVILERHKGSPQFIVFMGGVGVSCPFDSHLGAVNQSVDFTYKNIVIGFKEKVEKATPPASDGWGLVRTMRV